MSNIKPKILTNEEARELKFFCSSILGTRADYYKVMVTANSFDERIKRLEATAKMIEKFLGEKIEPMFQKSAFDNVKPEDELLQSPVATTKA